MAGTNDTKEGHVDIREPEQIHSDYDAAYDRSEAKGQDPTYDPSIDWSFVPADTPLALDSELEDF